MNAQRAPLTGEQLSALRVVEGADSVELKLTVPDVDRRSTVAALEMDVLGAQIRQVVFLDTPDLTLCHRAVMVRPRRVPRKGDDSVVPAAPHVGRSPHPPPPAAKGAVQTRSESR